MDEKSRETYDSKTRNTLKQAVSSDQKNSISTTNYDFNTHVISSFGRWQF
ncbi:MAG: hypothetical protein JXR48_05660 [Candidatus Delongbacteria bacterium]|nr:hypothetical protein [Candidatus Delongbacteria bacterium]MBN2834436.1 hypothetical protein [Candidatus Delongbacteria bacterium]